MKWYLKVLRQYMDFAGRARRREYWMFTLVNTIVSIVLTIVDLVLQGQAPTNPAFGFGIPSGIYS